MRHIQYLHAFIWHKCNQPIKPTVGNNPVASTSQCLLCCWHRPARGQHQDRQRRPSPTRGAAGNASGTDRSSGHRRRTRSPSPEQDQAKRRKASGFSEGGVPTSVPGSVAGDPTSAAAAGMTSMLICNKFSAARTACIVLILRHGLSGEGGGGGVGGGGGEFMAGR